MGRTPFSDALVFFGATGDLVFKEILPALHGLVREGGVRIPLIGVARSSWDADYGWRDDYWTAAWTGAAGDGLVRIWCLSGEAEAGRAIHPPDTHKAVHSR